MNNNYEGYSWITVPRYKMNEKLSWEERYKELEAHYIKETTFLIQEIRKLANSRRTQKFIK
jgi:hypothetical protein